MSPLSFADAVEKLSEVGIQKKEIYLIDLVLLCEMAWADAKCSFLVQQICESAKNRLEIAKRGLRCFQKLFLQLSPFPSFLCIPSLVPQ